MEVAASEYQEESAVRSECIPLGFHVLEAAAADLHGVVEIGRHLGLTLLTSGVRGSEQ